MFSGTMTVWTVWAVCARMCIFMSDGWELITLRGSSALIFSSVSMLFSDRDSNENFHLPFNSDTVSGFAAGGIRGNPSGLFLVPIIRFDRSWIRGNCFSVPLQFFEKICVGALTPSSRSSFGDYRFSNLKYIYWEIAIIGDTVYRVAICSIFGDTPRPASSNQSTDDLLKCAYNCSCIIASHGSHLLFLLHLYKFQLNSCRVQLLGSTGLGHSPIPRLAQHCRESGRLKGHAI